jgi:hypothetical protein
VYWLPARRLRSFKVNGGGHRSHLCSIYSIHVVKLLKIRAWKPDVYGRNRPCHAPVSSNFWLFHGVWRPFLYADCVKSSSIILDISIGTVIRTEEHETLNYRWTPPSCSLFDIHQRPLIILPQRKDSLAVYHFGTPLGNELRSRN